MAKHTQTIHRQYADELFECVWPLILSKFRQINKVNVFIEQSFSMISRGIKFDQFVKIRLILQAKFGDDP